MADDPRCKAYDDRGDRCGNYIHGDYDEHRCVSIGDHQPTWYELRLDTRRREQGLAYLDVLVDNEQAERVRILRAHNKPEWFVSWSNISRTEPVLAMWFGRAVIEASEWARLWTHEDTYKFEKEAANVPLS